MKRKVIQLAYKTLVISLPHKWVQQQGINKGDELNLEEKKEGLLIQQLNEINQPYKATINIEGYDAGLVWRHITELYRNGADEIEVQFSEQTVFSNSEQKNKNILALLTEIAGKRIGLTITKHAKHSCIIKDVTTIKPEEFQNTYYRLLNAVSTLCHEIISAIKNNDADSLTTLSIYPDEEINKLADYCARIINKTNTKERIEKLKIITQLELFADTFVKIAENTLTFKLTFKKITPPAIKIINEIETSINEMIKACFNTTRNNILEANKLRGAFERKIIKDIAKTKNAEERETLLILKIAVEQETEILTYLLSLIIE